MAGRSSIQWTQRAWNPIRGCSRASAGCLRCYAERIGGRFASAGGTYEGLVALGPKGPRWTGKVRPVQHVLFEPWRWKAPALVFTNSMSDAFHPQLPDKEIDKVFAVMAFAQRHEFQILTKRAHAFRPALNVAGGWFSSAEREQNVRRTAEELWRSFRPNCPPPAWPGWPLPNVWMGVSIEDQASADYRIPALRQLPARIRFLSIEPLLGPLHVRELIEGHDGPAPISWAIIGGESGPGARPVDLEWIRDVHDQCLAAGAPVFIKQLGSTWARQARAASYKGDDPAEWPDDLRLRQFPAAAMQTAA